MHAMAPALVALEIADPPAAWTGVGFAVDGDRCRVGGIELRLAGRTAGEGIVGWTLSEVEPGDLDGLSTERGEVVAAPSADHANGAFALDHVVVSTPDFGRTRDALVAAGLDLRRERDLRETRMAFFRIGATILELVGDRSGDPAGPARFWGLVVVIPSVDEPPPSLAPHLGSPRDAVQPGRRIATLASDAGLSPAIAFMTPRA
jgi:hypothetical protein